MLKTKAKKKVQITKEMLETKDKKAMAKFIKICHSLIFAIN